MWLNVQFHDRRTCAFWEQMVALIRPGGAGKTEQGQNGKTSPVHFGPTSVNLAPLHSASGVRRQETTNNYDGRTVSFQILKDFWLTWVIVSMKHKMMLKISRLSWRTFKFTFQTLETLYEPSYYDKSKCLPGIKLAKSNKTTLWNSVFALSCWLIL